jgi:hypothetical protein
VTNGWGLLCRAHAVPRDAQFRGLRECLALVQGLHEDSPNHTGTGCAHSGARPCPPHTGEALGSPAGGRRTGPPGRARAPKEVTLVEDDAMQPPQLPPGFYWLLSPTAERGGLAGMSQPRSEGNLQALAKAGVGLVISLLEGRFMGYRAVGGVRLVHLPIIEGSVFPDAQRPRVAKLCAFIDRFRLGPGLTRSIAVHCHAGERRTGMLLLCYCAYARVVRPRDREGGAPYEVLPLLKDRLAGAHGQSIRGPKPYQILGAATFFDWLQNSLETSWEQAADDELAWQSAASGTWTCAHCLGRFTGPGPASAPMWCPTCGRPSGPDGLE